MKSAVEFYKQTTNRDSLTADCKVCRNARVKRYRDANAEAISAQRRERYRANPEKHIVRTIEWQKANPDKMKVKAQRWAQTENGAMKRRATRQRRIARLAQALTPDSALVTADWFQIVVAAQGGKCVYCESSGVPLEMEHVEPISRGGLHVRENIVAACEKCNASKGARFLLEWRMGR